MSRHPDRERGSVTVELVLLTPLLIIFALAVVAFGRVTSARLDVDGAAAQAARAASVARHPQGAEIAAADTTAASLAGNGIRCVDLDTTVDTSGFTPGGWVAVTVTCQVDLAELTGLAIPVTQSISARSVAVIDTYRSTAP